MKKITKALMAAMMTLSLTLGTATQSLLFSKDTNTAIIAEAAANPYSKNYNIVDAVNYANKWWNGSNKEYKSINNWAQPNCASFVSECLTAGGVDIPKAKRTLSGRHYKYENTCWTVASEQFNYLKGLGYLTEEATDDNIHIGDAVYYDWAYNGYNGIDHATICIGTNSIGEPIIAEHSNCNIGVWDMRNDEFKAYVVHMTNAMGHKDVTNEYVDSFVTVKSIKNKLYVSSDTDDRNANSVIAVANRSNPDTWETFKVVENKSLPLVLDVRYKGVSIACSMTPSVSLKTNNGTYLSSYISESDVPLKNTGNNSTWEAFRIFRSGDTEYLLSLIDGKFVQVRDDNKLHVTGEGGWSWESFDICNVSSTSSSAVNNKSYTICGSSGAKVRSGAGTSYGQTGGLAKGSVVYYDQTKSANGYTWYHITSATAKSGSWGTYVGNWVANV